MSSNRGHQRAASNHVHEQLVIVFEELCPCVLRLPQDHLLVEWHWFEAAYRLVFVRA